VSVAVEGITAQGSLVLSMKLNNCKESRMLTILALALRRSEGLTLETSPFESLLRWPIHIINPVGKTKFQSTVRKKMAAVHFTTIPCEPN